LNENKRVFEEHRGMNTGPHRLLERIHCCSLWMVRRCCSDMGNARSLERL
jgi:hypothetical protein